MNRSAEYTAALNLLDQMLADGRTTRNEYDVKRAALLAEASAHPRRSVVNSTIKVVLTLGVLLLVLLFLSSVW